MNGGLRRSSARSPGGFISLAHETDPRLGEYERTVTTVLNAYIGPLMHDYIGAIIDGAAQRGFSGDILLLIPMVAS